MTRRQSGAGRGAGGRARGRRTALLAAGLAALLLVLMALLWLPGRDGVSHAYSLAPESVLPANFRNAPPDVRDAYRFAIANREILRQIPCYCGCGDQHQSNAECYIKDVRADGSIDFDLMSFG